MSDSHLIDVFDMQARACTDLGSPMYVQLLAGVINDIKAGGVFADVLAGHEDDPGATALAPRLLGGLHGLALDGRVPRLRRWYPSTDGTWDSADAWDDIVAAARQHAAVLRAVLDRPPQTNEVGRSAALVGALLIMVHRFPFPVRLFEIGASAGLNLRADHYLYRFPGGQRGDADSPVVIEDAWRGIRLPEAPVCVVERHGYDIAPVDPLSDSGRLTLLSYVWPDMTSRLQRLRGAIDTTRRIPAWVDRLTAADAVAGLHVVPGTLTVLRHSITWQYLGPAEQDRVKTEAATLGAAAHERAPFVWLSLEPQRRLEGAGEFEVRARCWPGRTDEVLGVSAPHGPPVTWTRFATATGPKL